MLYSRCLADRGQMLQALLWIHYEGKVIEITPSLDVTSTYEDRFILNLKDCTVATALETKDTTQHFAVSAFFWVSSSLINCQTLDSSITKTADSFNETCVWWCTVSCYCQQNHNELPQTHTEHTRYKLLKTNCTVNWVFSVSVVCYKPTMT